jgi:hypothetical protein
MGSANFTRPKSVIFGVPSLVNGLPPACEAFPPEEDVPATKRRNRRYLLLLPRRPFSQTGWIPA